MQDISEILENAFVNDQVSSQRLMLQELLTLSPWLSTCVVRDPQCLNYLQASQGQSIDRSVISDELWAACLECRSTQAAGEILLRRQRMELLRIAFLEVVHQAPPSRIGEQLTDIADAILDCGLRVALEITLSEPEFAGRVTPGQVPAVAAIAHGGYGGQEVDYSNQLEVFFIAAVDQQGHRDESLAADFVTHWLETLDLILSTDDELGVIYSLRRRLRFPPSDAPRWFDAEKLARTLSQTGETGHRKVLAKSRYAAGHAQLARDWIRNRHDWLYPRYLTSADQIGLRTETQRISRQLQHESDHGGREDTKGSVSRTTSPTPESDAEGPNPRLACHEIELVTQFLQLLNGSDLPQVRTPQTLHAIEALEQAGCLTMQERAILSENYIVLQRFAHLLQLATDLNASTFTHKDWEQLEARRRFESDGPQKPLESFREETTRRARQCRQIADHLIHDLRLADSGTVPIESELVLAHEIDPTVVAACFQKYRFSDPEAALTGLNSLANEPVSFLSSRRSRHFLAAIAPKLLEAISATPSPDATLARLVEMSDSLGGKAALWELFQQNDSALQLGIRICAASPYLTGILTDNPGMLDELMDSLILDALPTGPQLHQHSVQLSRFAQDIGPILQSFKNSAHLRIGVRDLLGRDSLADTHRALADTADECMTRLVEHELNFMADRYGDPLDPEGEPVGLSVLAFGHYGAREPNYHSPLQVLFIYDTDGHSRPRAGARREGTSNAHFFNELIQRVGRQLSGENRTAPIYEFDPRSLLPPSHPSLVMTVAQFASQLSTRPLSLWKRLSLLQCRPLMTSAFAAPRIKAAFCEAIVEPGWRADTAREALEYRISLQQGAGVFNLKRSPGGTLDVEVLTQLWLLRHAKELSSCFCHGTLSGIELLREHNWLPSEPAKVLTKNYLYLRRIESYLRLMQAPARHDLPEDPADQAALAYALREPSGKAIVENYKRCCMENRELFEQLLTEDTLTQNH